MKAIYFFLMALIFSSLEARDLHAQSARLSWAEFAEFRNDPDGMGTPSQMYVDPDGYLYVWGVLTDSATDFDPGPGEHIMVKRGIGRSGFLARYDPNGAIVWAVQFEARHRVLIKSVVRIEDMLYVTAIHTDTVDVDPGPNVIHTPSHGWGLADFGGFILRLDLLGVYQKATFLEWTGTGPAALDQSKDLVLFGMISDNAKIDSITYHAKEGPPANVSDKFVCKIDHQTLRVKSLMVFDDERGTPQLSDDVASVDSSGNIFILGEMATNGSTEPIDFDPGPGVVTPEVGNRADIYLLKLSSEGAFIRVRRIGGTGECPSHAMVVDRDGAAYIVGSFTDTADFDPGSGSHLRHSAGPFDMDGFVLKLDANGEFKWLHHIGSASTDEVNIVTLGQDGSIYIGGQWQGTVDFDPGPNEFLMTSTGRADGFIQKLTPSGESVWIATTSGSEWQEIESIGLDAANNISIRARSTGSTDFDPCLSTHLLTPDRSSKATLMKLYQSPLPCPTSKVESYGQTSALRLYPQPITNAVTVTADNNFVNATIRLIDIKGDVVQEWFGLNGPTVDLKLKAGSGAYTLEVQNQDGTVHRTKLLTQ